MHQDDRKSKGQGLPIKRNAIFPVGFAKQTKKKEIRKKLRNLSQLISHKIMLVFQRTQK